MEQNKDAIAIRKLRNNIPLTKADYNVLESILTNELGNQNDYTREFGDTPFGLLIRKIAKLEHQAAIEVFSTFISEQNLNQQQIVFVNKIIDYVTQNGYIENPNQLLKSPFDKPVKFIELFNSSSQKKLIDLVRSIKENAENIVG